jgi:1-acyl-sn-glycerol-3-phosphate acyltransferase
MIRSAFVAISLAIVTIVVGAPLVLYVVLTGNVEPLYNAGVAAVVWICRVAGMRTRVEGLENIPPGTVLFAANHTSNADGPAIVGAIPRRIAILGKKSLFTIPIVGTAFRLADFVPVDRHNRGQAAASIEVAAEKMKNGVSFLIYPEGTRSSDGRLLPFRRGAIALAIKAGVPVVPVACSGAHRVIPKKSYRITPGEVVVRFCPAIDSSQFSIARRNELAERVHAAIATALPPDQKPAAVTKAETSLPS